MDTEPRPGRSFGYEFDRKLLDRLAADIDWWRTAHSKGFNVEKDLWAGSVDRQIAKFREIHAELKPEDRPDWFTKDWIDQAERMMKEPSAKASRELEEYAFRWRDPDGPGWHVEYADTARERDFAMDRKSMDGADVQAVPDDPAALYRQHRHAACLRARHILERHDSPDRDATRVLRGIVREVGEHRPDDVLATYPVLDLTGGPEDDAARQRVNRFTWEHRDEILDHAANDGMLSTWALYQLDHLKEPQPDRSPDRDQREPDRKTPAQAEFTPKRHGPRL